MALGDSYATLAEFKARTDDTETVDDSEITDCLAATSRAEEKFCLRQFNKQTGATARVYYPTDSGLVLVDDFWTTASLVIKTDQDGDGVYETTLSASDYQLEPLNGISDGETGWPYSRIRLVGNTGAYFPLNWWNRRASVEVTAQWGWNAVPAVVKQVCLDAALEVFKLKDVPFQPTVRIEDNARLATMLRPYRRTGITVVC